MRTGSTAQERTHNGRQGFADIEKSRTPKPKGRIHCSHGARKLVGAQRQMCRHAGNEISRQRNQTAAARHGINEAAEKNERTNDEKSNEIELHGGGFPVFGKI